MIYILTEEDWNIVFPECKSLCASWEEISCYLGLPFSDISTIKHDQHNSSECWSSSLKYWIKQNYNTAKFGLPSWQTLLSAVAKVDKLRFKQLAASHQLKKFGNEYLSHCRYLQTKLYTVIIDNSYQ